MNAAGEWLAYGQRSMAGVLRAVAAAIEGLADWIDAPEIAAAPARRLEVARTRERIAATLVRARSHYDASTTARPRSRR